MRRAGRITCWIRSKRRFRACLSIPGAATSRRNCWTWGFESIASFFFRPYRIIYRVIENNVYVLVIADGRRDMQSLLQRRLLQA